MREDLKPRLDLAATAPLRVLDTLSISRVAKRIDEAATSLIRLLKTDDVARGDLRAGDVPDHPRGRRLFRHAKDQTSTPVLVGMLLIEDAKSDPT